MYTYDNLTFDEILNDSTIDPDSGVALYALAQCAKIGKGIQPSMEKYRELLSLSASEGYQLAIDELEADNSSEVSGVEVEKVDHENAFNKDDIFNVRMLANQGNPYACLEMLEICKNISNNLNERKLYSEKCRESVYRLSNKEEQGKIFFLLADKEVYDKVQSRKDLELAWELGNLDAAEKLISYYQGGIGGPREPGLIEECVLKIENSGTDEQKMRVAELLLAQGETMKAFTLFASVVSISESEEMVFKALVCMIEINRDMIMKNTTYMEKLCCMVEKYQDRQEIWPLIIKLWDNTKIFFYEGHYHVLHKIFLESKNEEDYMSFLSEATARGCVEAGEDEKQIIEKQYDELQTYKKYYKGYLETIDDNPVEQKLYFQTLSFDEKVSFEYFCIIVSKYLLRTYPDMEFWKFEKWEVNGWEKENVSIILYESDSYKKVVVDSSELNQQVTKMSKIQYQELRKNEKSEDVDCISEKDRVRQKNEIIEELQNKLDEEDNVQAIVELAKYYRTTNPALEKRFLLMGAEKSDSYSCYRLARYAEEENRWRYALNMYSYAKENDNKGILRDEGIDDCIKRMEHMVHMENESVREIERKLNEKMSKMRCQWIAIIVASVVVVLDKIMNLVSGSADISTYSFVSVCMMLLSLWISFRTASMLNFLRNIYKENQKRWFPKNIKEKFLKSIFFQLILALIVGVLCQIRVNESGIYIVICWIVEIYIFIFVIENIKKSMRNPKK